MSPLKIIVNSLHTTFFDLFVDILCLHRISSKNPTKNTKKPAVLFWHGFLMNSEVFLCRPRDAHDNLPFLLADLGYKKAFLIHLTCEVDSMYGLEIHGGTSIRVNMLNSNQRLKSFGIFL